MPGKRKRPDQPQHDASYKNFFTHSETVADTMRLAAGELARRLDFDTLERLPASFAGPRRPMSATCSAPSPTNSLDTGPDSGIFSSRSGRWTRPRFRRTTSWR